MVETDGADRREGPQIVFVWRVIAVPCHHINRRMRQHGHEQLSAPLHEQFGRRVLVFIGRDRGQEIARIGKAIGADRPALRQREGAAVVFADVAARGARRNLDAEFHAARNHHDLAGLGIDPAELGDEAQIALLWHEQHLAIGIVEMLIGHRFGDEEDVRGHAGLGVDVSRRGHGLHALQERHLLLRDRRRIPAQLRDRPVDFATRRAAPQPGVDLGKTPGMFHRRPDPVQP